MKDQKNPKGSVLYVRGRDETMKNVIDFTRSAEEYDRVVNFNKGKGLKSVVFGSKHLNEQETKKYLEAFLSAEQSSVDRESKLVAISTTLESNLTLECIIGFKNALKPTAKASISMLREMDVRMHLLTGDTEELTNVALHSLGLLSKEDVLMTLKFTDEESGKLQLKKVIDHIWAESKKQARDKKKPLKSNFVLLVDGECLETIQVSRYLKEHTKFVFYYAKMVVAYKTSGINKMRIVEMFKKMDRRVMAVGSCFEDVLMMQRADVGIQVYNERMKFVMGDVYAFDVFSAILAMHRQCLPANSQVMQLASRIYELGLMKLFSSLAFQAYVRVSSASILNTSGFLFDDLFVLAAGLASIFLRKTVGDGAKTYSARLQYRSEFAWTCSQMVVVGIVGALVLTSVILFSPADVSSASLYTHGAICAYLLAGLPPHLVYWVFYLLYLVGLFAFFGLELGSQMQVLPPLILAMHTLACLRDLFTPKTPPSLSYTRAYTCCFQSTSTVNISVKQMMYEHSEAFDTFILYKHAKLHKTAWALTAGVGLVYISAAFIDDHTIRVVLYSFIFAMYLCAYAYSLLADTIPVFEHLLAATAAAICFFTGYSFALLGCVILAHFSIAYIVGFKVFSLAAGYHVAGLAAFFAYNADYIKRHEWGGELQYPLISLSALFVFIAAGVWLMRRNVDKLLREEFSMGVDIDSTSLIAKDLLGLLLPKFVLDRMQNFFEISEEKHVIDVEDPVTILFCDIADFDEVVRKNEDKVVFMLDKIFRKFDDLCILHGIQKIETVGKTYMAAAGLKQVESGLSQEISATHHTLRTINFAKGMMEHIKEYEGLNLKIGIHIGKPVMGVIGYHKPQFSLIGDVVNTTSRHCTTGKKGRIMLSEDAWECVKNMSPYSNGYSLEIVQTEMKGKGEVAVYHLYAQEKHFHSHLERIVANRNNFDLNSSEYKSIEIINKAILKVIQSKKLATQGLKLLQLVQELKPTQTLQHIYSQMTDKQKSSSQGQPGKGKSNFPNPSSTIDHTTTMTTIDLSSRGEEKYEEEIEESVVSSNN